MYAVENSGRTTRLGYNGTGWVDGFTGGYGNENPIWGYAAWMTDVEYGGQPGAVGPGLLVGQYLSEDGRIFFCPSQYDHSHIYDGVIGWINWGEQFNQSYGYEGTAAAVVMGSWARRSQRTDEQITAVHSDIWYWYHYQTSYHTGINTAYTDGSVHWTDQDECEFWGRCMWTGNEIAAVWQFLDDQL